MIQKIEKRLGPIFVIRKTGEEVFSLDGNPSDFTLMNFWQWSASDLVSNATRGILAEFIVAKALDIVDEVRSEWDPYDLITNDKIK